MWLTVLPLDMLLTWYHIKHFATVLIIPTFYFCIQLTGLVSVSQFFDLGLTRRVWSRPRSWSRPHILWSRSHNFWSRSYKTYLVWASVLVSASHSLVSVSQFLVSVLQDVFGLGLGLGLGLTLSGLGLTVFGLGLTRRVWFRSHSRSHCVMASFTSMFVINKSYTHTIRPNENWGFRQVCKWKIYFSIAGMKWNEGLNWAR